MNNSHKSEFILFIYFVCLFLETLALGLTSGSVLKSDSLQCCGVHKKMPGIKMVKLHAR